MLIKSPDAITPDTLTAIFRHHGLLRDPEAIKDVRMLRQSESGTAQHYAYALTHSRASSINRAPTHIFVKLVKPDPEHAEKEVRFYNHIVPPMRRADQRDDLPLVPCYDAYYDPETHRAHLILKDLSTTHKEARLDAPLSDIHRNKIMDGLAFIHAFWWEKHEREQFTEPHTDASLDAMVAGWQAQSEGLIAHLTRMGKLGVRDKTILQTVVSRIPAQRRENMLQGRRITLVHRDTHPRNFLYAFDNVRLIDWQSWRADTGTDDVAYHIACHWPGKIRKFEEKKALQRYYDGLLRFGVRGYTWDDCLYDYRASIARCIAFLVRAWSPEKIRDGWWDERGARALRAFDDWDGMALYT